MKTGEKLLTTIIVSGVCLALMWGTIIGYYPNDAEAQQVGYAIGGLISVVLPFCLFGLITAIEKEG